ncbi:MAG: hypothetical protein EXS58_13630 [Candidatus Latescibacteria bacterium]|nr:hypothetical protein [Candidatus Latescibacterota bacterium]
MKKRSIVVFCLISALASVAGAQPTQLFYVFSAEDAAQRLGAHHLDQWNEDHGRPLRVMGLVQHQGDVAVMEQMRLQEGISFQLMCATAAQQNPGLPAELSGHLDSPAGFVLLVDAKGRAAASGAGAQLNQVLDQAALLLGGLAATEVDESTWGKVKEIFK